MKKEQKNVGFDQRVIKKIEAIARQRNCFFSEVVRELVDLGLETYAQPLSPEQLGEDIAARFRALEMEVEELRRLVHQEDRKD